MFLRHLLLGGVSRAALAPQTDNEGGEYDEDEDDVSGADADLDDEGDGDEDGGEIDPADTDQDSGSDDDSAEGEVDDEPPPRQLSRAEKRIQALSNEAKAATESAAQLRNELAALKAERTRASATEAQAAERQRLENMSPDERAEYRIAQLEKTMKADLEQTKFTIWDQNDKTSFETMLAQRTDLPKDAATKVEEYVAQMRAAGTNAPRATVLRYVIGDLVLAGAPKARKRAQATADENRRRETVAPPRTRQSDAGRGGRRSGANTPEGREARLMDRPL